MPKVKRARSHKHVGKWCYAGISELDFGAGDEPSVYIGGRYYGSTAQIHLDFEEARRLAKWLTQFADWDDSRKAAGK